MNVRRGAARAGDPFFDVIRKDDWRRRRYGPYSGKDRDPFLILGPSETPVTASHSLPAIDLSRCVLRTISQDGAFVVCRGAQPATSGEPASVLVVMPRTEHPRPECLQMLEHEYALRADLDPTWAVRPRALSSIRGARAGLDDPGGELLAQSWERRWSSDCACGSASVWPRRSAHCTAAASSTRT